MTTANNYARITKGLAKLASSFLSFGPDPVANINLLTRLCGELMGADCALYNHVDRGMMVALGMWNTPADFNSKNKPDGRICYDVIKKGGKEIFIVRDLPQSTYAKTDPNVGKHGLKTYIGMPVKCRGECVGSLCLLYHDDFTPSPEDRGFIGVIAAIIGLKEDRKRSEQELRERNDELTRFSYAVSHDLKSPLVTITTFLGYLEEEIKELDAKGVARNLGYIRTAADKMCRLLKELQELSRVGHKMNSCVETPLRALLQEALVLAAGHIIRRGIRTRITGESVMVFGDRQRLLEAFQNLFDNAAKFMGEQPAPLIEAGVDLFGAEPVFFVRDNGIGIDPRHQAKIFGLFEKLDSATEGTGIGLALVRRIIEVHGGRIWVESEGPGKGTTFRFTLANIRKG